MSVKVGDEFPIQRLISIEDIESFAKASGDYNPIHLDDEYAKKTIFKRRIAHGMLSTSYISTILGTTPPEEGAICLTQNMKLLKLDNNLGTDGQAEVFLPRRSEDV